MVTEFFDLLFWVAYMSNVGKKKLFPPNNKEKIYALQKRTLVSNIRPKLLIFWTKS